MDVALDEDALVTITREDHPKASVQLCDIRTGGDYFQRLWLPIAGPSSVALVNRSLELTRRAGGRAEISAKDLAQSLGIPGRLSKGAAPTGRVEFGKNSPLLKTLDRAGHMGFGRAHVGARSVEWVVYNQVGPLRPWQVDRLPEFLRQDHWDVMGPVAVRLAERGLDLGAMTDVGPGRHQATGDTAVRARALAQLDQLRTPSAGHVAASVTPVASI